jgi:hypothetical protein
MEGAPFLAVVFFVKFVIAPGLFVLWAHLSPPKTPPWER